MNFMLQSLVVLLHCNGNDSLTKHILNLYVDSEKSKPKSSNYRPYQIFYTTNQHYTVPLIELIPNKAHIPSKKPKWEAQMRSPAQPNWKPHYKSSEKPISLYNLHNPTELVSSTQRELSVLLFYPQRYQMLFLQYFSYPIAYIVEDY